MTHYHLDGYEFVAPSTRKGKKYDVYKNGKKLASFGALGYEQYRDIIGHYSDIDHNDLKRRKAYRARHKGENLYKDNPGWFAWHYLW